MEFFHHAESWVLVAFILFIAVIYAVVNLLVDLAYGVIDPRLRTR